MVFGQKTVVDGLSFEIREGEIFGLLGANGSGKTTVVRSLLGMHQNVEGQSFIGGKPYRPSSKIRVGYLPEERGLYRKERVIEVMTYFGRLAGMGARSARAWSMQFLERMHIADKANLRLDRLSGGQQQKVQLGVTMMGNPQLLVLDEPAKGFDPINRSILSELIDERRTDGAAVLLVTHEMPEAERRCDRILLLKDGAARAYGTVHEVQDAFGGCRLEIAFQGHIPQSKLYRVETERSGFAILHPADGTPPESVLAELMGKGLAISSFKPARRTLDEIFIEVYGSETSEREGK